MVSSDTGKHVLICLFCIHIRVKMHRISLPEGLIYEQISTMSATELFIGKTNNKDLKEIFLNPAMANRHGLIAGATGTGKSVTLQTLAQNFSKLGVPVFLADIKGDLSGLAIKGSEQPKIKARLDELKITDFSYSATPVMFWDVFGEQGHPVRATVSDMGPILLSRLLGLNDTQEGVLNLIFKIADDQHLHLYDLKDLQAMLKYASENAKEFQTQYGNISAASVGAIQRALLAIETQGADKFFGEPMLNVLDFIQTDASTGYGYINIFSADKLMLSPKLYAMFLLWMLSELFENLPEVGDLEKPKIVFFFDEAHLLFNDAPKALIEKIEQVVRLIRSKGVGVYFASQNPLDLPDTVLAQLGNRFQHALRAFTPNDKKAVQTAADTMRENPNFKTADAITQLAVGEALVSVLEKGGVPSITERVLITPPSTQIGPISPEQRKNIIQSSIIYGHYEKAVDSESAYELLQKKAATASSAVAAPAEAKKESSSSDFSFKDILGGSSSGRSNNRQSVGEAMVKSAARTMANEVGRQVVRGLLGGIFGKRR